MICVKNKQIKFYRQQFGSFNGENGLKAITIDRSREYHHAILKK